LVSITISGLPGSGTSTLVNMLSESLNWKSINGGQIFRELAKKNEMTLSDFGELCKSDSTVDMQLDAELQKRMLENHGPEIIESRLAGHWAHSLGIECEKIWIEVEPEERAKRVSKREGSDWIIKHEENKVREQLDSARFHKYYNIDISDMSPYSLIIDSTKLTAEEVLRDVIKHIKKGEKGAD